MRQTTIGRYIINWDDTYYLAYVGGTREIDTKEYQRVMSMPMGKARQKELAKLPKEKNPNLFPIKGLRLLELMKDMKFVPLFDKFFTQTNILKLTDLLIYESIKSKSYETFMK